MKHFFFFVAVAMSACACGITPSSDVTQPDIVSVPARRGTIIADGCTLDAWQLETLASPKTKKVVTEVVLDCLVPHADGSVGPADASAQSDLDALVARLHTLGYGVSLAASFVTDDGVTFDGKETADELADPTWVTKVASGIAALAATANGVDLDLEQLPASARPDVTELVTSVAAQVRPAKSLGVFLPPATTAPSDVPGGDAFDVAALAPVVDRFRVMTLDFSGNVAGPTIDSGWAVDAVRFAEQKTGSAALDVAFPLYGNDFTLGGTHPVRLSTYFDAVAAAATYGAEPTRSPSQEIFLDYTDDEGTPHELWYDDARSTLTALGAWDEVTLPSSVGVVFYGFGAEDPALWDAVAGALP